jgi:Tol biopolymer transport system component
VRQLTFGPAIQEIPKWSPDGRRIAFGASPIFPGEPGFHTDIWIMRADGTHKRQLTRGGFDGEPVFSPDGRRIAFARITHDAEIADAAICVMTPTAATCARWCHRRSAWNTPTGPRMAAGSPSTSLPQHRIKRSWPSTPTARVSG